MNGKEESSSSNAYGFEMGVERFHLTTLVSLQIARNAVNHQMACVLQNVITRNRALR